jgi:pimeloyl-ACP methyl ester carboxylesterase
VATNRLIQELEPFYFGEPHEELYGCFHPVTTEKRSVAAVLCSPLGDEAIRIHRAYKQIAIRLNRAGFPTFRFDYYGWGDSAGEDTDATINRWEKDIAEAIRETKRQSGVARVVLIGLRLGATLALNVANGRQDIAGVVLWEPITSGEDYLRMMEKEHQSRLSYFLADSVHASSSTNGITEVLGFVLSPTMREQMQQLNVFDLTYLNGFGDVLIVEKSPTDAVIQLKAHLEQHSFQVVYQCLDDPAIWGEDPDKALIPGQTLKAIAEWFNEKFI